MPRGTVRNYTYKKMFELYQKVVVKRYCLIFLPKKAVLAKDSIQLEKKICRKMAVTCLTLTASLPVTVVPLLLHTSTRAKALMIPQLCVYLLKSEFWKPLLHINFPVILDINLFSEVKWHVSEFISFRGKKAGERDAHCLLHVTVYRSSQLQVKKKWTRSWVSLNLHCKSNLLLCLRKEERRWKLWRGKARSGSCVKVKHRFSPRCKRRQKLHAVVLVLCAQVTAPIFLHPRDCLAAVSDKEASELASPPPAKHCKGIFTFKSWEAAPTPSQEWICWHV